MLPSGTEARRAALELKLSQARDALQAAQGGDERGCAAACGRALAILLRTAGEDEQALAAAIAAPAALALPTTAITLTDGGEHKFELLTRSQTRARAELVPPCDDYEILIVMGCSEAQDGPPRKMAVSLQNGNRLAETTVFPCATTAGEMMILWGRSTCGTMVLKEACGLVIEVFGQPADIFSFNVIGRKPKANQQ